MVEENNLEKNSLFSFNGNMIYLIGCPSPFYCGIFIKPFRDLKSNNFDSPLYSWDLIPGLLYMVVLSI